GTVEECLVGGLARARVAKTLGSRVVKVKSCDRPRRIDAFDRLSSDSRLRKLAQDEDQRVGFLHEAYAHVRDHAVDHRDLRATKPLTFQSRCYRVFGYRAGTLRRSPGPNDRAVRKARKEPSPLARIAEQADGLRAHVDRRDRRNRRKRAANFFGGYTC